MKFAKRMDRFGEGIFSKLAEIKKEKTAKGEEVIDLSIGAPNIPPAPHIMEALCRDVYKRQAQDLREAIRAVREMTRMQGITAVSYTHLDVYKRQ